MNPLSKAQSAQQLRLILKLIRTTKSDAELHQLLEAILTPSELDGLMERAQIVKGLIDGKTQRAISVETGAGLATIARGSRELKYGSGILQTLFQRIK